jgi:hypothetical protein
MGGSDVDLGKSGARYWVDDESGRAGRGVLMVTERWNSKHLIYAHEEMRLAA